MKNIFNPENNKELMERLQKLSPDSQKQWGKMTVSQMLLHCQKPLEVAEQKLVVKRGFISFLFGKMMKTKLINKGESFTQNLPTAKEFIIDTEVDFEKEKQTLKNMLEDYGLRGESVIVMATHPFFGNLSPEEWGILFYKHLDHHFTQFSV
ncbi:DUF1569 domain-containing protein [Flavobacterium sp. GT3R68]|uniref:DUF1569 domain-containing protein n=1 Tax=Flavobacterium sp. GT3R68 TaxID=2594437 RepID=UPI000F88110B|nr:DUF1569 domain-containing protein [Flavobacterium sp. GT3R68]RTY95983.1 DUF1569 domain-containing protein [Flavobacterium sp. GSN2]TRW93756.1 DUF1569 domain-containing protein [Flavobacterium sp. GT3R68]